MSYSIYTRLSPQTAWSLHGHHDDLCEALRQAAIRKAQLAQWGYAEVESTIWETPPLCVIPEVTVPPEGWRSMVIED